MVEFGSDGVAVDIDRHTAAQARHRRIAYAMTSAVGWLTTMVMSAAAVSARGRWDAGDCEIPTTVVPAANAVPTPSLP